MAANCEKLDVQCLYDRNQVEKGTIVEAQALVIKLQARVKHLESALAEQNQATTSTRCEAGRSDSSGESELSEDEHIFNRLHVSCAGHDNPSCRSVICVPCV